MSQRVTIGLALGFLLIGLLLLWGALRGPTTRPPSRQVIPSLQDTVTIDWTAQHTAVLEGSRDRDVLTALGYLHGMQRAWTLTIWRQTALGRLSATFGTGLVPIDRHSRTLGFSHQARRTYDRLNASVQKSLQAYTRGLNAALQSKRVRLRTPFVFFNLTPERWEAWHPLAIERLLAWIGTAPVAADGPGPSAFRRTDERLRRWLHLHGRTRSIAWGARNPADTTRAVLFGRHVLGATAEPVMQEVKIHRPGSPSLVMGTLPGTLLFPTGTTGSQAWTYLLGSPLRLTQEAVDTTQLRTRHERIRPMNGDERLVSVRRYEGRLMIDAVPPDSAWLLQWPGLRPGSDVPQWTNVARLDVSPAPQDSTFNLFSGMGLIVDSTGTWTVRGEPSVVEEDSSTILVGRSEWARHQANALRAHAAGGSLAPAHWSQRDSSTWAAGLLPGMLADLSPLAGQRSTVNDALSYLRNWPHEYEPSSIGAVVFEEWMRRYRAEIGHLPYPTDSAFFAGVRRRRTFRGAVHSLTDRYGPDVRRWRWERAAPARHAFPVWSADSLIAKDLSSLSGTRFAPLERPGRGHASALAGGPSLVAPLPSGPAPTSWDGWMRSGTSALEVRRLRADPSGVLARSLLSRTPPPPVSVEGPAERRTVLIPAEP